MSQQAELEKLKDDIKHTIEEINKAICEVHHQAEIHDVPAHQMRHIDGSWALGPLLIAKAQATSALVSLYQSQRAMYMQTFIEAPKTPAPPYPPAGPAR